MKRKEFEDRKAELLRQVEIVNLRLSGSVESHEVVLLGIVNKIASLEFDGHVTLMRFTTGWKVLFGTPNLDDGGERETVRNNGPDRASLGEALENAILNKPKF